ncbi:Apc13p-domain-containing protein [Trichocladium antarcticum]|uniref:Apc13p-domain-containing protein n=1 Tax=Trichocladium antarcticum TaxID=1450529 RepID=A0AAN6ZHS3_9PEZI|nr:Apc13p-domain-containing protein [Trichocladium antarcticum]
MNKDACFTYVHMQKSHHADLFEDFCKDKLPADDIYVPEHLQPINPEEEDDVVPNQHAAFGVQKATQRVHEPAWKDLGLKELMARGPGAASTGRGGGKRRGGAGGPFKGLPR